MLSLSALFAFVFLLIIDLFAGRKNPYVGILAYLVAPSFFLLGVLFTIIGFLFRWI